LFGDAVDNGVAEHARSIVDEAMADERVDPQPLQEADLVAAEQLDAFLHGLGIDRKKLHPQTDVNELMLNAGTVLREFVEGVTQLLASRANMKNAFRLEQTTVLPRHNNPIKLSANVHDSILQLLVGREGEYLGPRDAVREVCRDLLFHQDAFLDAMNAAFTEFADRFDPDELQDGFDRTLASSFLTRFMNKSKYWQMYRDHYPILTDRGGGRFPQMYAEEFVRAYERQIAEFKRLGLGDVHLKATVVLNKGQVQARADADDDVDIDATAAELAAIDEADLDALDEELASAGSANDDESIDELFGEPDDSDDPADSARG
jgi:type VI secretion system FHA domain protein